MTLVQIAARVGLANQDAVWNKLADLQSANSADPYQAIANLDVTHALTRAEVSEALLEDVVADTNAALKDRENKMRIGVVVIGLLVALAPVALFALIRQSH
jgi:hypothetical protein